MSNKNEGGAAFPRTASDIGWGDGCSPGQEGMTLRDYFAAKAMASMIQSDTEKGWKYGFKGWQYGFVAEEAYKYADAMLAERDK
jgi:hypothetical protein